MLAEPHLATVRVDEAVAEQAVVRGGKLGPADRARSDHGRFVKGGPNACAPLSGLLCAFRDSTCVAYGRASQSSSMSRRRQPKPDASCYGVCRLRCRTDPTMLCV